MVTARELATSPVITARPDESLFKAIKAMTLGWFRHLPVLDGSSIVGILTSRDVIGAIVQACARTEDMGEAASVLSRPISEFMSPPPPTVGPADTLEDVAARMRGAGVGAVLLVVGGDLGGIITERDLVKKAPWSEVDARVSDVMTTGVRTLRPEDTVLVAASGMASGGFRRYPVVGGNDRVLGVLTARDVIKLAASGEKPCRLRMRVKVSQVMSSPPVVIEPEAPVSRAAALMASHDVGCLPVVKRGRLTGIVTESDLLRVLGV